MKRFLLLACLLLSALSAQAGDAEREISACDQSLQAGNFAQAAQHAQLGLRSAPDSSDAYLCLGRAQGKAGMHMEAVAALQAAVQHAPQPVDRIVALTMLGNQYMSVQAYGEAAQAYHQGLDMAQAEKIDRYQHISLNMIGRAMQASGDPKGALDHFQQGLKLAANDNERAESNANIAAAQSQLGNHDKAIEHQLKAMLQEERSGDLDHYANANVELGRICMVAGQYVDAEKWLSKFLASIQHAPYWEARGHFMLGRVKAAQGKTSAASDEFAKARALATEAFDEQLIKTIDSAATAQKSM